MLTSGQLAKKCHVSLRTVQYYDRKGLLHAHRTENNRREYRPQDLFKLQQIIIYRDLGFQLNDIQKLLDNQQNYQALSSMIDNQSAKLQQQLHLTEAQIEGLNALQKQLKSDNGLSTTLQKQIKFKMTLTGQLYQLRLKIILWGLIIDFLLWGSLFWVIYQGASQWYFVLGLIGSILICWKIISYYYHHAIYLCPHCQFEFVPQFKEWLFSSHTPNTRKLTCPHCHKKGFCIEEYR
ncbi:MerR family transcriptional regulator [uncultured Limosilactobacillus sp.]|uniref:MerR family transcriptional regulator n=1 Tax=uncultured Limosilactobacillus sp. TaxID=2837629 RepID=UPI002600BCFE|nr:MerR family transcriptional regulator [uncultured Limosilactobacillus sp.]